MRDLTVEGLDGVLAIPPKVSLISLIIAVLPARFLIE